MFSFQRFFAVLSLLLAFIGAANVANAQQHGGYFSYTTSAPRTNSFGAPVANSLKPHPQPPPHPVSVGLPAFCQVYTNVGGVLTGTVNTYLSPPECYYATAPYAPTYVGDYVIGIGGDSYWATWQFWWSNDAGTAPQGTLAYFQGCSEDFTILKYTSFPTLLIDGSPAFTIAATASDRFNSGVILSATITYNATGQAVAFAQNPPGGLVEACFIQPEPPSDPGFGDSAVVKPLIPLGSLEEIRKAVMAFTPEQWKSIQLQAAPLIK